MNNNHVPVMLKEVLSFIPNDKKINLIDATFGGGGYSKAILKDFNIKNLIAIDRDPISKIFYKELKKDFDNIELFNQKFSKLDELLRDTEHFIEKYDVIIFDLGVSSNQIDDPERGFSFQKDGPLDMKMGSSSLNAFEVINSFDEKKLADIFYEFGEEKYSRRIAKNIVINRTKKTIENTLELSEIIKKSVPAKSNFKKIHPATKTFQALRIFINDDRKRTPKRCWS